MANTTTVTSTATVTTTTTQIVATGTPAPAASLSDAEQTYLTALQTLITVATSDLAGGGLTRTEEAAARAMLAYGTSALLAEQKRIAVKQPTVYTCTEADSILPTLAQRFLGDPLRYTDIQALNGLRFIALSPGQQVLIPAS
jgi:nucleoid-associated protein YgaU